MSDLLIYLIKFHRYAGKRLYVNVIGMSLISVLEGIGIYLLVPMLSVSGLFPVNLGNVPFMSSFKNLFNHIPNQWSLPAVLLIYMLLIVGQSLLSRKQTVFSSRLQQGFILHLRIETYQALIRANWSFYIRKRKSDLSHMMTNELARVSLGTVQTLTLLTSFIFTAIQIGFAFWLSAKLTLFIILSGVVFSLFSRKFVRRAKVIGERTSAVSQDYMAALTEHFNGIKDIKSNSLERSHIHWFRSLCRSIEQNYIDFIKLQSYTQFIYKSSSAVLIVLFVYVSIKLFYVAPEQLVLVVLIFSRLWPRFTTLQNNFEQIVTTLPALKGFNDLLNECDKTQEPEVMVNETALPLLNGMECRELYFRYDLNQPEYTLKGIDLYIPANQTTAIVGKSGAGKSTLVDILIGLIQPEEGTLLIDGVPLSEHNLHAFRSSISYVSQDPFLFHASIRENLQIVEPGASEERMWEALAFSASDDFVRKLPKGLDTVIGDRGIRLSGGERQRIVLARAIMRRPSVLVLDEATSALDNENEAMIQKALDKLKGNMTIVIIAHRLSTIRNADQVIVLEQGEVVQHGGYQQLSRDTKGTFGKLLAYQLDANR